MKQFCSPLEVVSIFLGNGDGTFKPNVDYGSDGGPGALAVGDFNRDGQIDLAIANFNGNNATHVSTLLGNGDGTFGRVSSYGTGQHPTGVVSADFNGDGNPDLATVNTYDSTVSVLLGLGRGKFGSAVNYAVNSDQYYGAIVSADFNGDGHPDLATINFSAGAVSILLNEGNGTFGTYKDYPAGPSPQSLVAGDFNNDQKMDLVVGNLGADASLLLGNGNGGFQAPIPIASGLGPYAMAVADFNGDGNLDLATVNGSQSSSVVSILLGACNGTFATAVNYSTGSGPAAIVAADLNKDGKLDLGVLTTLFPGVSVLLGNGDGTFQNYSSYPVPNYSFGLLAADFNGQNNLDLAVLNQASSYAVELLAGDGQGHFSSATPYYPGIGPASFVAADFDKSGSTDLAVTNAIYLTSSVTILLNTAVAALSLDGLHFPPTAVGTQSQPMKVQFSNPGTVSVKIRSISVSGANAGDFVQTSTCGNNVAVGASCTVTLTFRPSQKGKRSALLKFTDNAIAGTQVVSLAGTGR